MKLYVEIDKKADISEIWTYIKTIPDQLCVIIRYALSPSARR